MSDNRHASFASEVMLAGWSETHTGGAKVTFWLPDGDELAYFKGLTAKKGDTAGQRFAIALIEIPDDEQGIDPSELARRISRE